MTSLQDGVNVRIVATLFVVLWAGAVPVRAESPNPTLHTIFPPGAQAGTSVAITVSGTSLEELRDVRSDILNLQAKKISANQFAFKIPSETLPGIYDLRVVGLHGISSPRSFVVGTHQELVEKEPNDSFETAQQIPLDSVFNSRIEKPGDVDCVQFAAKAGQRVVLNCWARRIDSLLRGVLEVYDSAGKRLAVNRGYHGIDPLVELRVPVDGIYVAKISDLSFLGSANHFYRLEISTQPMVEFAFPCVVERGKASKLTLVGRNLSSNPVPANTLDRLEVMVTPPVVSQATVIPSPFRPSQIAPEIFPYFHPGSQHPVLIGVTDSPVVVLNSIQSLPDQQPEIPIPGEVCGQLTEGDAKHTIAVQARRGEAIWIEAFGERIGSPVELVISILDASGQKELAKLPECLENLGHTRFSTSHSDPTGRWIAPANGRYLIAVRNRIGGTNPDPRRIYRLSIRREEPDSQLIVLPRLSDQESSLNVPVGGRAIADVIAIRKRGFNGPIRVSSANLPSGIHCPDVWIGPGQDRAPLVISSDRETASFAGVLNLTGHVDFSGTELQRRVFAGSLIWPAQPMSFARLSQTVPLATATETQALLSASIRETSIFQENVIDVSVDLEQRFVGSIGTIHVTSIGLPKGVANTTVKLAEGKSKGNLSLFIPETVTPGNYTFAIQADLEISTPKNAKETVKSNLSVVSNPITIQVKPSRIHLEIDPRMPKTIGRGKTIQLNYSATRQQGFIGKIHTELVALPGEVGLRSRGVTFVGGAETGTIQIIASDDAPLGRQRFLRLEAVGTVEDQPVYHASRFVELEITE